MTKWFNWRLVVTGGAAAAAALAMAAGPAAAAPAPIAKTPPVNGAEFTTTNPAIDNGGTGSPILCLNGNPGTDGPNFKPAVNCNVYTKKSYVWLSGGPGPSHLSDGTYFFAVLVPGGQPDPNDGGDKNLSDTTCAPYTCPKNNGDGSAIPSGDDYTNRTFSISDGTISYSGSHDFKNNLIRAFPYDDTTNPGGVYILATCSLAAGYPANASDCKYDAFKVQEEAVQQPPAADLVVTKDASGSDTKTYAWNIAKAVDKTTVDSSNGSATFNYTVTVTHDGGTVSHVKVTGTIQVFNPNTNLDGDLQPVDMTAVSDQLSDGTVCTVTGGGAQTLTQFETDFPYTCDLSALPQGELDNTATVSWADQTLQDGVDLAAGSANFVFTNISFAETVVDECVDVTDTLGGTLGTVCVGDNNPTEFDYSHTFTGDPAGTCTSHDNTATFTTNDTRTTDSASKTVKVCVGADLKVSKTAAPSFTRTFHWGITKSVDNTLIQQSGTTATFNYTVNVTHDTGTDSAWLVSGTITVKNPNDWEDITANVGDAIDNNGTCTVTGGSSAVIPAGKSVDFAYSCIYASAPSPASGINTASATWDASAASTPDGAASGTAAYAFGDPTNIVDGTVSVTDTLGGTLGTVSYTDPSPKSFTYSHVVTGTPGTCVKVDNTATFTTNTTGTTGSANQSVKLCVGADLVVTKAATPSFTRTYAWSITKAVDKTLLDAGGTATYTVVASETGFTDSNFKVSGTITVSNPNDWESIAANVADAIDNGGSCSVTNGSNVTIPAKGSAVLNYSCTFSSNPGSGTNTATATWDKAAAFTPDGTASGTAAYDFASAVITRVNLNITVTDTILGGTTTLGTLTAIDTTPFATRTFIYTRHFNPPSTGCVTIPNTAKIVETNQTASASVRVCNTGALTMGFWQNKNGQAIIKGDASTAGVCNSGTWLRQFAPFQDLSATATCSQVAAYFTNVFNAANAGGATMNSMLKAQMLATALNVYFSDPGLGGNKIGAPAPIGGVTIDLTKIYGSENVSAAFGGATSLTVQQMLTYAASQSDAGGLNWYGQNKVTQGLAKDAFDSINNQNAVSP